MVSTATLPQWPIFSEDEIESVSAILRSGRTNYWNGEHGKLFEQEFASWVGVRHAVALANGTIALEYALRALGVGAGDEVVVTPRSFMASASCVVSVGARPVFADIDGYRQNISASTIEAVLSARTRAIICVHLGGYPCAMAEIQALARKHGLALVEDCAQAHGAQIDARSVGCFSDIATWSFCQDKIISCAGEGGMLTTDDAQLWRRVWQQKDHGKSPELAQAPHSGHGFRWLHESFGSNGRMTEVQAAIGRSQLRRLTATQTARERNAGLLARVCQRYPAIRQCPVLEGAQAAWYRFYCFIPETAYKPGHDKQSLLDSINRQGFPAFEGSCPEIYKEAAFADYKCPTLPMAERLGRESVALLCHQNIDRANMDAYAAALDISLQSCLR